MRSNLTGCRELAREPLVMRRVFRGEEICATHARSAQRVESKTRIRELVLDILREYGCGPQAARPRFERAQWKAAGPGNRVSYQESYYRTIPGAWKHTVQLEAKIN